MDKRFEDIEKLKQSFFSSKENYLAPKGKTGAYLRYRILRPLLKIRYKLFRSRVESAPWLSPVATRFFDGFLDGSQVGCEFGSGASTYFFAKRVKELVSIEHYHGWFDKMSGKLSNDNLTNVDYRLIEKSDQLDERSTSDVFPHISGLENYDYRKDYVAYFQALSNFPDEHFDFIIVDGRARPECTFSSISKLKQNGLMILDNSERSRYDVVFEYLKDWEMINTSNGLTDTTFWIKP